VSPAVALALLAGLAAAAGILEAAAAVAAARASGATRRGGRVAGGLVSVVARLGRGVGAPAPPRDLGARLDSAGSPLGLAVADVMGLKGGAAVLGLLLGAPVAGAMPGRLPLPTMLALPVAGFLAPDLFLARRARRRGRAMEADMPALLDLLRVAVQAGLSVDRALAEVGARHRGELAREWRAAAAEIELGVPRAEVLRRLVDRCPAPGVPSLVAALERAERHGAPLSDALGALAAEARAARARRIRDHAAKAAPKIQLAVALLLVPSVLLLVAAAMVGTLIR